MSVRPDNRRQNLNDERDEILVLAKARRKGRAGMCATEIALAATEFQRRPGIRQLKWLGDKIGQRLVGAGKMTRVGDRYVVVR